MTLPRVGIGCLVLCLLLAFALAQNEDNQSWKRCSIYLAPSEGMGDGMFAAQDFKKGDIIDITSMFLIGNYDGALLTETILTEYIYEYPRHVHVDNEWNSDEALIGWGYSFFFNHSPEPNIKWSPPFGLDMDHIHGTEAFGYYAMRDINRGEELFCSYTPDDSWFTNRGMTEMSSDELAQPLHDSINDLAIREEKYCSKIHSGYSVQTFREVIRGTSVIHREDVSIRHLEGYLSRLTPFESGLGRVVAKEKIREGQVMESVPALAIPRDSVMNSIMEPLVWFWEDFPHGLTVEYVDLWLNSEDATKIEKKRYQVPLHEMALLPIAGSVGLILRDVDNSNCRAEIEYHDTRFSIKIYATQEIEEGETLRLDMKDSSSEQYRLELYDELERIGQMAPDTNRDDDDYYDSSDDGENEDEESKDAEEEDMTEL
eukprot:scaffold12474_cov55-Attheya_sp.AAC.3